VRSKLITKNPKPDPLVECWPHTSLTGQKSSRHEAEAAASNSNWPKRKYHRFKLHQPVLITFESGESHAELEAVSENVSSGGVLLKCDWIIPLGTVLTLKMNVPGQRALRPLRMVARGETIRVEGNKNDGTFYIAVRFVSPVTRIEAHRDFVLLKPMHSSLPK
jgi:PilZ domain